MQVFVFEPGAKPFSDGLAVGLPLLGRRVASLVLCELLVYELLIGAQPAQFRFPEFQFAVYEIVSGLAPELDYSLLVQWRPVIKSLSGRSVDEALEFLDRNLFTIDSCKRLSCRSGRRCE